MHLAILYLIGVLLYCLGCTGKFSNSGHRVESGLPQLQIGWISVHYTASAHARHDPVHIEIDPFENHHRRDTVRKDVRSRPGHKVHVRLEPAERVPAERVRRDDGVGKGRLRVHGLPEHRLGRTNDQTERKRYEHIGSGLVEFGHSPPLQLPRRHTAKGRRFKYLFETKASDNIDHHGRRTSKAVGLRGLRRR